MKYLLLALSLTLSLVAVAQDKEKISTGHKDILSSTLVDMGECETSSKELASQLLEAYSSDRTSLELKYSVKYTTDRLVRFYDKKQTKIDGEKKEELINVREVKQSGIVSTKEFKKSVELYKTKYSEKKQKNITKRRKTEKVLSDAIAKLVRLETECERYRSSK